MGLILFGTFFILLALGVPIGFSLAIAAISGVIYADVPLMVFGQRLFSSLNSFPLMAIPLFMLAGSIMGNGGITNRLINFSLSLVGRIRGSLAHVVSLSGIMMGGISGSAVADTAALGTIMVPEMEKKSMILDFQLL